MYKNKDLLRGIALTIDSLFVNFICNNLLNSLNTEPINFNFMLLTFIIYFLFFDYLNNGQTLGKLIVKIKPKMNQSISEKIEHSFLKSISIFLTPVTILIYLFKGKILHDILLKRKESPIG